MLLGQRVALPRSVGTADSARRSARRRRCGSASRTWQRAASRSCRTGTSGAPVASASRAAPRCQPVCRVRQARALREDPEHLALGRAARRRVRDRRAVAAAALDRERVRASASTPQRPGSGRAPPSPCSGSARGVATPRIHGSKIDSWFATRIAGPLAGIRSAPHELDPVERAEPARGSRSARGAV